jgi:hypothetical protein
VSHHSLACSKPEGQASRCVAFGQIRALIPTPLDSSRLVEFRNENLLKRMENMQEVLLERRSIGRQWQGGQRGDLVGHQGLSKKIIRIREALDNKVDGLEDTKEDVNQW